MLPARAKFDLTARLRARAAAGWPSPKAVLLLTVGSLVFWAGVAMVLLFVV